MSVVVLCICVLIATVQVSAWQYCSNTTEPVSCVPCEEKSVQHGYKCPRQCGAERSLDLCDSVCSDHCVRSECEYDVTGTLKCLNGCTHGHHGDACDEKCRNCKGDVCDNTGTCINGCKSGYYGERCDTLCDKCKQCDKSNVDCDVCDKTKGTCLLGCTDGYHGAKCDRKCQARCAVCHVETGQCQQCAAGWYGNNCQQECQNCRNKRCSVDTGQCTDGCENGFQGTMCQEVVSAPEQKRDTEKKDPEKKKAMDGLSGIFEDDDYLLPVIGCLLVLFGVIAVVIFCRCRKSKVKENETPDEEDGKCNGLSPHPSLRRSSVDSASTAPLYQDLVEEAIRTHSCEKILKKHNMLDPDRPKLSPLGDKSLASLRNRTGNLSMPFMTPIEEDEEEEIEDDGVHMPNVGIIFTLESPSDDDGCDHDLDTSRLDGSHEDVTSSMESVEPKAMVPGGTETSVDPTGSPSDPARDIYILQRGSRSSPGDRAISFDHLDTTHSSGRSTPMVPDMYLEHPHGEGNHFSTMLTDHLDTFLTDRSNPETAESPVEKGMEVDVSESDALLGRVRFQINNNQVLKSKNPAPSKLKPNSSSRGHIVTNGDTGLEREHVSLSSESEPMLSHTSDSSA